MSPTCRKECKRLGSKTSGVFWEQETNQMSSDAATQTYLAIMIPPLKTTTKMASTPTVLAMMGSRPRAAQPRKRAQEAVLVRNRMSQWSQNLQEDEHNSGQSKSKCCPGCTCLRAAVYGARQGNCAMRRLHEHEL